MSSTTKSTLKRFHKSKVLSSPETIEWDEEALKLYSVTKMSTQKILQEEQEPEVKKCFLETLENMGMFPFLATFRPDLYDLIKGGSHTWDEYEYCRKYWKKYTKDFLPLIQKAALQIDL